MSGAQGGADGQTVADAALALLARLRGPGGMGAAQCDQLAAMLETVRTESRILAKANKALVIACGDAKEALLRCRVPDGDEDARLARLRAIGSLEDMARGVAETDGLRVGWLAVATAEVMRLPAPRSARPAPSGVLPFGKKEGT